MHQLPLTPPDYLDSYPFSATAAPQLPAPRTLPSLGPQYDNGRSDLQDLNSQWPSLPPVSQPRYSQESARNMLTNYGRPLPSSNRMYGNATVPMLPPIRIPERIHMDNYEQPARSKRVPTVGQTKEDKPVGGVAAHLDYEMDDMVDFVSQTAQGMYDIYVSGICLADIDMARSVLDSRVSVHPDLRKYVSQVLSSTRLPSSTIILGLHYLAKRMTMLSNNGRFNHGNGQVYHMLTIALLLGSKFLDDNTFQNRSWSEVSNISVSELNESEIEWLVQSGWDMHIDPEDPETFMLWHRQWKTFLTHRTSTKVDKSLAQSLRQTHMNGDGLGRQRSINQRSSPSSRSLPPQSDPRFGDFRKSSSQSQWATPRYDPWQSSRASNDYSPPSAPETGPTTPEWYGTHNMFGYGQGQQQGYTTLKMPPPLQILGSNALSGYPTPYTQEYNSAYVSPYGHGTACGCQQCMPYYDRYGMATEYGPQSVVG
ncbi:hypothetical protein MMC21_004456 [Puttea exsequens]|nr:hypothetical protein [Puttea exsequens]